MADATRSASADVEGSTAPGQSATPPPAGRVRAFIALELTDEVKQALARIAAGWKREEALVSWVRAENLHVTLVFLGEIETRRVDAVRRIMDGAAAEVPPFELTAAGAGTFGSASAPRVVWGGFVDPPEPLIALQRRLTDRLAGRGFDVSRQAFRPHVTLGRVRGRRGVGALTAAVASANNTRFGIVPVRRVVLMQSLLSPQGARYILLHESRLQSVP